MANAVQFTLTGGEDNKGKIGYAYPGVYKISADTKSNFIKGNSETIAIPTQNTATLSLAPTDSLKVSLEKVINAEIDQCAQKATSSPENCPFNSSFSSYSSSSYKDFKWSVDAYPGITMIDFDAGTFALNGGKMRLSYLKREYDYDAKCPLFSDDNCGYYWENESDDDIPITSKGGSFKIITNAKGEEQITIDLNLSDYSSY
jgi:hypothetical protein